MDKQEEKKFDKYFEISFEENDVDDWQIKNWITDHDKRMKDEVIEEMINDNFFELLLFGIWTNGQIGGEDFKGLYELFKKELINKHKNNEKSN